MLYQISNTLGSYYFDKKRGIVNGIITSGTVFGLFIFSPLTARLVEEFGLSGTFYILAGIALPGVICGFAIIFHTKRCTLNCTISITIDMVIHNLMIAGHRITRYIIELDEVLF